jgi:SAM-dependent methyltransferase
MIRDTRNEVKAYYERGWEKDRLKTGKGHVQAVEGDVEKTRTIQLLTHYIQTKNAVILDVGGAAGAYSFWLAGLGHEVHLVDLTPLHIEQALEEQKKPNSPRLASCSVGDACNLRFASDFADVILCMGPLYHLPDDAERKRCLQEAFRVLKSGGLLFAVGISRFVPLFDFLRSGRFTDIEIAEMIRNDIDSGCHLNPTQNPMLFTTAFLHVPDILRQEIFQQGFIQVEIKAIEGPILFTKDLERHWAKQSSKNQLLTFAKQVENEPSIIGVSNHIAAIALKP